MIKKAFIQLFTLVIIFNSLTIYCKNVLFCIFGITQIRDLPFKTNQLGGPTIPVKQIATYSFLSPDRLEFRHVSALLHQALAEK